MMFGRNFWNVGICDFSGFDVLCQRMREGKRMCKDYIEFLKHRAQIHEIQGKALVKLSKTAGGREEIGTLRESWEVVRVKTEEMGLASLHLSNSFLEEATNVSEFVDNSWLRKKQAEENVRKLQNTKKARYKKAQEMKRVYFNKSRDAELLGQALLGEMGKTAIQPKEIDKLKQKHSRLEQSAEQAEQAYRSSLNSLDDLRIQWERETETTCELFQELEESRIRFLRNSMWTICNLCSGNCLKEDEMLEIIRNSLEKCSEGADINQFVNHKQTGSQFPAPVQFEPYRNDTSSICCDQEFPTIQRAKSAEQIHMSDVPLDTDDDDTNSVALYATVRKTKKSSKSEEDDFPSPPMEFSTNDVYESAGICDNGTTGFWKVTTEHKGQHSYELSLKKNDRVKVIRQAHKEWWWVETQDGQTGYFPAECLKPVVPPKIGFNI